MLEIAINIGLLALFARVIVTDFLKYKIHNVDVLALLFLSIAILIIRGWVSPLNNVVAGVLLFILGVSFWLLKWIGAGDVKLLAVCGFSVSIEHLFGMSVLTLFLSIGFLGLIRVLSPLPMLPRLLHERVDDILSKRKIPYGVPLALATGILFLSEARW